MRNSKIDTAMFKGQILDDLDFSATLCASMHEMKYSETSSQIKYFVRKVMRIGLMHIRSNLLGCVQTHLTAL